MKATELLELVRARLSIPAASWIVAVDKVLDHEATGYANPRYVWVPTRGGFGPAEKVGGNPRQLYTRNLGLELHLWAESVDDAETRLLALIEALHLEAATSVVFRAENWLGESVIGRGVLLTLEIEVKLPVTRALRTVHQATAVAPDTSGASDPDGVLEWGEG